MPLHTIIEVEPMDKIQDDDIDSNHIKRSVAPYVNIMHTRTVNAEVHREPKNQECDLKKCQPLPEIE